MRKFHITQPDQRIKPQLIDKINNLTKPKGALGMLEDLALQIGLIQQTLTPTLCKPHNILLAGDHGIVEEGVSKSPNCFSLIYSLTAYLSAPITTLGFFG